MKFSNDLLKRISFLYIFLPVITFIIGFLKIYIAIPLVIVLLIILCKYIKSSDSKTHFEIPKKCIFIVLIVAFIWVLFSGVGKLFYQPTYFWDHIVRNTIYNDLIMNPWPVQYDNGIYLCYYIGQWLVPSLFGKVALFLTGNATLAYTFGNVMLYIWCAIGITLIFLWLIKILKAFTTKKIIFMLIMFILFSGLDVVGEIITGEFETHQLLNGFEWWLNFEWQYSSFTSLLFWVYNQAIPAMLITLMLYDEDDYKNRGVLLVFGLLFAPYPMVGLGLFLIVKDIIKGIKEKSIKFIKQYFSLQNILSALFIFPILFFFLYANYKVYIGDSYYDESMQWYFDSLTSGTYFLFVIIEFLLYSILSYSKENKENLIVVTIFLLIIPLLGIYDFVMRISIPCLIILFICIYKSIFDKESNIYKKWILCILLCIAALNPQAEINRGIYQTYNQGFIGSTAEEYEILQLDDYYRYNYISYTDTTFFKYLAKENNNEKDSKE